MLPVRNRADRLQPLCVGVIADFKHDPLPQSVAMPERNRNKRSDLGTWRKLGRKLIIKNLIQRMRCAEQAYPCV